MATPAISSQHQFVRPPKSSRRNKTPPNGEKGESFTNSITKTASNAYSQAPDLGISKTIGNVYQNAPNLGIQSTFHHVLGYDAIGGDEEEGGVGSTTNQNENHPKADQSSQKEEKDAHLDPHEFSRQKGPSSQDRIGKSQKEVGTEYGIPTSAGAGTTVSPDKTNKLALKKSHSNEKTKPRQAFVPEDYAPLPCPDKNAGTGKCDEIQTELANKSGTAHYRKKSENRQSTISSHSSQAGNKTPTSTTSSNERKRRSFGLKMRDQIKGELKILSGSLTNNEEKIIQGLNIKHGEQ